MIGSSSHPPLRFPPSALAVSGDALAWMAKLVEQGGGHRGGGRQLRLGWLVLGAARAARVARFASPPPWSASGCSLEPGALFIK